jgi:molecular chaperone HtpG
LRCYSTLSSKVLKSFDESVERINLEQKRIYWIGGKIRDAIVKSPILEYFQQKGIKVLFLIEPINGYYGQQPKDDSDHKLISITKENCEIAEMDEEKKGFGTQDKARANLQEDQAHPRQGL